MAILKAPLRCSRALCPMGSMLLASHPGGMESAWLRAANPAAAIATAPPAAAHRRYFMERIRFLHGCGQWPILERIPMKWNRCKRQPGGAPPVRICLIWTIAQFHSAERGCHEPNVRRASPLFARCAVMCLGKIVALAPAGKLHSRSQHPYTLALLSAVPFPDPARR